MVFFLNVWPSSPLVGLLFCIGCQLACMCVTTVNSQSFASVYFRETSRMRRFMKIRPPRNAEITLSFIDIGQSWPSGEFLTSLTLFVKIKFSRKFPNFH